MLYLAFIYHMHQPYYKNLLTDQADLPWVRLHGTKDYLDMVSMLKDFPLIRQTINVVPSLFEQVEDYTNGLVKDKFLELSYKPAQELNGQDKGFILNNFFMINRDKVIATHPRYYELYLNKKANRLFNTQDYLDLQVWFNLAWIDPCFRQDIPELRQVAEKARFFTEEDKRIVLEKQIDILEAILPAYKDSMAQGQIEVVLSPYYHPILPLLCNTRIAKEANPKSTVPGVNFSFPEDARLQIDSAVKFYKDKFGRAPIGMWPSEMAVSEHILPFIIQSGIKWILADEAILFKSLKKKKRDTRALYQPYSLDRKDGSLNIVFRDRNLSDLIGFTYANWKAADAVEDFMKHLENTAEAFKGKDVLVTVAMDGENAWEYFANDGHDFLELLYRRLSEAKFLKTTTVNEYLNSHSTVKKIERLAAGSWIYGEFSKWINNPYKNKAWECLALARQEMERCKSEGKALTDMAIKQMQILEGSDWFWWAGEDYPGYFDRLFRMHLANLYSLLDKEIPEYLSRPIVP
ncbi:MAG: glycoside hydrolase family 57 protein [Candidatus Omnitrophica bacterium]|jgi:alpha-amylase/alpha-mannosidase (GH57 family)|nr:glycoside hydrolase family 57 protein [Candidatus Omnitrophota bacterium]MDD5079007.1 glycoside hydrolase family 57 protein [Candidatus Omnitrophota bacterium]